MLSIRINRNATLQTQVAAVFAEILPNRLQAAQSAALEKSKQEIRAKLPELGDPAKYILVDIVGFGPIGATLKLTPQKSKRSSKSGYDRGMGAYVFIKGRRGGRVIRAKNAKVMKLRQDSVAAGYPRYLKKFKLGALKSHRDEIRQIAKQIILNNIRLGLRTQGFGTRGGTPARPATDQPFTAG
jgi:hypothetical protein